jgi:hypothetical protein
MLVGKLEVVIFEGVILARNWYKRVYEQLLCEIGSSIRQQIRDVYWSGG